ncbi:hypothetical protein TNCV_1578201 [Trichonephila clavipes]|nr:hypothetical protein TNCV_1578201 [Trichonephila clavipes]
MNRATTTYPSLSKGYVEVFPAKVNSVKWRSSVMLVPHGVVQRRRNMCCVKKFRAILVSRRSDMPYLSKGCADSTVK